TPMQHRWERWLTTAEDEVPRMREHAANAPSVEDQAKNARDRAQGASQDGSTRTTQHDVVTQTNQQHPTQGGRR
ncbi:hypothetical protein, partial [Solicola sp. PLA-1-18]|uniref:hypothetical protein n=1 Tax=Solicola sp. PLA-1-18 TaxID=3380532 RepID=UPI003B7FA7A2